MPSKPYSNWRMTWTKLSGTRRKRKKSACELLAFLRRTGYPFIADWSVALLRRCHIYALRRGPDIQAAVWFEPMGTTQAAMHLCAAPQVRGRWVTPATLRTLSGAARSHGFHTVIAEPLPHHVGYLTRLGFTRADPDFYLSLYEPAQNPEDPGRAATRRSGSEACPAADGRPLGGFDQEKQPA